ncbi:5'-nucleotidase C-terminal domain-containing protein [Rossellomorea vietnamensis]|uniref:5'-nucleotidase C-terminal domain-containing protein n=1 Tax=Rossellomorea vietnamensis TaxID=218284 RepID=A0ACD4C6J0_9BACI|nr:5'-nucleotidase C-terminal domain-containing protein [Rossellomorea vietnamensis]UXH44004.1 5'-nucleotidase C-terminal domain-containing protein [Rossellomorea vietnamensis]
MSLSKWMLAAIATGVFFIGSSFASSSTDPGEYISVQLLGVNDFHGQLETVRTRNGKQVGGAEYLAAYLKKHRQENENTLLVHSGDMVGASSPVSSLMQDEPAVEWMNEVGFDIGTLGNHEFDEGTEEMFRLLDGGKHEKTGTFEGAAFPYTAANVIDKKTGKTILPPYLIKEVDGVPIGFIGVVTTETKDIVLPSGIEEVEFTDEVTAINQSVKELKAKGVRSIVVLGHVSASSNEDGTNPAQDAAEFAPRIDDEVDIIFGGHSHGFANTSVDGKLIVQSYSYGTAFSDVDLLIDRETKDIVNKQAAILSTYHDGILPDKKIKQMVDSYSADKQMMLDQKMGQAEAPITKEKTASGERPIGNLIADSHRENMHTDIAFMNPGGIRANLDEGELTWGDLYTMLPFGTNLVKLSLTGAEIKEALEQQWTGNFQTIMQTSGLDYTYDKDAPPGHKVVAMTDRDGNAIQPDQTYTVALTNYLATGGDGFTAFKKGNDSVEGPPTLDSFITYIIESGGSVAPPETGRIKVQ